MSELATKASASDWEKIELGEVLTLNYGKALPKTERNPSGQIPVYGANGIKDYADQALSNGPTLIIGRKGSAGQITRVDGDFWPLDVTYFTSHDQNRIDFDYLAYALSMLDLPSLARGVKPGINRNDVYALEILMPSTLDEQKRIVAVLDQAFAALDRAHNQVEKNLRDAKEIFVRVLDQVFPSVSERATKPLTKFINIEHGYAFKSRDFETSEDAALPIVLTPGNYSDTGELYFRPGKTKRLKCEAPENFVFEKGELTVVMTDLSPKMNILGKPAFITRDNLLHNQRIGRIRFLNEEIEPRLIYYFFRARSFSDNLKSTATGTMVRHTAPKRILSCEIPEYSRHEQADIVSKLDRAQSECLALQHAYKKKAEDILHLRRSLLDKAFSGELG